MYAYYENPMKHIFISHRKETYDFSSHFHGNLEVVFCFNGAQNIKIGENSFTMETGDAAIIFPNIVHEYVRHTPEKPTEILAIIIDNKLISEAMPDILSKHPTNPLIRSNLISEETVRAFKNVLESKNDISLIGWTYVVLSGLLNAVTLVPLNNDPELAPKIISYIDNHFKENLNINHLAAVFGYSQSYIAHIFCDQLKIPFRTYLGAVRSEFASTLIKTTKKSLTEIAYESGYVSLNTFCRCFKKHFSVTPSEYRKKIKE
ncbi:MAG: helix-turn-helix transcriptional regulator [Oscillospiraceae bacterium]|nr:helix-turn-helix transcriptional regulator [Oscillospiraceae bacterium]